MRKIVYVYQNDNDLSLILNLLFEKGIYFYNEEKIKVDKVQAICNNVTNFYISCNQEHFIEFSPSFYTLNWLQAASFYIDSEEDSDLYDVFKQIKKYIQRTYRLSQDKSYYIGQGIYQDWLEKKYCFPVLFEYEEFLVDESDMKSLFNAVLEAGSTIRTNNARLRNIDVIDLDAESFIIFKDDAKLLTTIVRKSIIRYEYGSDCIFVYKRKKTKQYAFQLDKRIVDDFSSNTSMLFEKIKMFR